MKRSTAVTLVISGALLAGCGNQSNPNTGEWSSSDTNAPITNNTYVAGQGYWHAPYHSWYPYPYNYYRPGFGYYYGGSYYDHPEVSSIHASTPLRSSFSGSRAGIFGGEHVSISRGGFGSSAHFSGS